MQPSFCTAVPTALRFCQRIYRSESQRNRTTIGVFVIFLKTWSYFPSVKNTVRMMKKHCKTSISFRSLRWHFIESAPLVKYVIASDVRPHTSNEWGNEGKPWFVFDVKSAFPEPVIISSLFMRSVFFFNFRPSGFNILENGIFLAAVWFLKKTRKWWCVFASCPLSLLLFSLFFQ